MEEGNDAEYQKFSKLYTSKYGHSSTGTLLDYWAGQSSPEVQEPEAEPQGLLSQLKERNVRAFGAESGAIMSALNPSETIQTESAVGRLMRGEQGLGQTAFDIAGQGAGAVGDIVGAGIGKVAQGANYLSGGKLGEGVEAIAGSEAGQAVGGFVGDIASQYQTFKEKFPEAARNLENTVNIASIIPLAKAPQAITATGKAVKGGVGQVGRGIKGIFSPLDDIAKKGAGEKTIVDALGKSTAASMRETAEATQAVTSLKEKIVGIRPDIKKRIQGKSDKLKEYFDVSHARNLDDTVQTPFEYAHNKSVVGARDKLKSVLDDTGSKIGGFRATTAKEPVTLGGMKAVRNSFVSELQKLNLTTNNKGQIVRAAGKVKKASDSEIKLLQSLYDDLGTVRELPTRENLLDLRNAFDDQINFAKTSREASDVVDPLSRTVRGTIRDVNLKGLPKEQAKLMEDYSDLYGIFKEFDKAINSKSGSEFLLKRVLSERGRIPRELMQKVYEYTGIDLMDDATMAQLATEIIGNPAQKGLFRQEIAKAGLDVMDIAGMLSGQGGFMGAVKTLAEPVTKLIAPIEKTFLKAAQ